MAVTFTGIQEYVDEHKIPLLHKLTLTAPSVGLFNIQTGIKHSAALNILQSNVQFGDCGCGWDPAGGQEFTQRILEVGCIKINGAICDVDMMTYWANNQVRISAGKESLGSFEADFVNDIIADVVNKVDAALYKGDTTSADANLNKFDGLLKILTADVPSANKLAPAAGTSAYTVAGQVYAAIPNAAFKRGNVAILMGTDTLRKISMELTDATMGSCCMLGGDGKFKGFPALYYPNSSTYMVGVEGLDGTSQMIGLSLDNVYFGTDLQSDYETIKFWYSDDNQEYRYSIKFLSGVQVAFPDEVIMATVPAAA